ncbi:hypothetical protein ACFVU2_20055 [Leifsonia sp. NPDC058194]|uniref:hypothetical protein n=1 Tax=Leifsonia sp. NPDC058194 TaxID=3346374 RepID=UPI0036DCA7E1
MRVGARTGGRIRAFWPQRSRAQTGVLVSTALTVLVIAFLACTMAGLAVRSPTVAVRQSVEAGPASTVAVAYQAALDPDDPAAQDRTVRSVLERQFRSAPVTVDHTAFAPSIALGTDRSALALADAVDLRSRTHLRSGDWPTSGTEIAIDTALAHATGLSAGSRVQLTGEAGTVTAIVSGVWAPLDPSAPAWLGVTAGTGGTDGRAIASPALLKALTTAATGQWVVTPDASRVTAGDLPRLRAGYAGSIDALTECDASPSPFAALGGAAATVADMQQSVGALAAVVPVPLALLAVCSAISLVLLARLLTSSRWSETRVLRARGATVGTLVRADAVEAAAVALVGTIAGTGLALAALAVAGPGAAGVPVAALVLATVVPALAVLAVAVAATAVVTAVTARSADAAPGPAESGRGRSAASLGLGVLTLATAGVTLWRFLSYGAPDESGHVDAVGTVAPAAVLSAVAVIALVGLGPLATAVERLAARRRGLSAVLPARQVSRGVGLVAAPVALVVLAVGAATFAAGYSGTWSGFLRDSSRLVAGSDVRVDLGVAGSVRGPEDLPPTTRLSGIPTVSRAAPALVTEATLGQSDVTMVAVDASALPGLVDVGSYMFDPFAAFAALNADPARGIPIPAGARTVEAVATATVPGDAMPPPALRIVLWVADDHGALAPLPAEPAASGAPRLVSAALPAGGPWRLLAVDAHLDTRETAMPVQVRITALHAGDPIDAIGWKPAPAAFGTPFTATVPVSDELGFDSPLLPAGRDDALRLVPGSAVDVPVLITRATADAGGLEVGARIDLDSPWASVQGTIAGVVAAVPGTTDQNAALIDLAALDDHVLRTAPTVPRLGSVWLATPAPQAVARAAAIAAGADAVVADASGAFVSRFMSGAVTALWLGAAGCALLAVVAVSAAALSALRGRRAEVVVLRAVGLGSRQQASARRREFAWVVAGAAVVGLLGGLTVFLLAGNALARLSVVTAPSTLSVQGRVDPAGLVGALLSLAIAVAVVLWLYGRAVRAQVADTAYRSETR